MAGLHRSWLRGLLALAASVLWVGGCGPGRDAPAGPSEIRRADASPSPPLLLVRPAMEAAPPAPAPEGAAPAAAPLAAVTDPVVQDAPPGLPALAPGPVASREGLGTGLPWPDGSAFAVATTPPDPNGDVGPDHYVQAVNVHLLVLDKAGAPVLGPMRIATLFAGFAGGEGLCAGTNQADPVVAYDALADRWIVTIMANRRALPAYQCTAVSATPDPTGPWHRYAFGPYTAPHPVTGEPVAAQNDYGKLGVWPDAYYVSYAMEDPLSGAGYGPKLCAWERAAMLQGAPARELCFQLPTIHGGVLPADHDGVALPPPGAPGLFLAPAVYAGLPPRHVLQLWRLHADFENPGASTLSSNVDVGVSPFNATCPDRVGLARPRACVPQAGADQKLDTLGHTLMHRVAYRRLAGGAEAVVATHTVDTTGDAARPHAGIRWYELRNAPGQSMASAPPVLHDEGTFAPDGDWRWMGSVAQDQEGNVGLAYSVSGSTNPTLRFTGRGANDPRHLMSRAEASPLAAVATGAQDVGDRWGDYSALVVDPRDDCTFWFTGEYLAVTGSASWRTRVATFKFPDCPSVRFRVEPAAASVQAGQPVAFTVSAVSASGAPLPSYAGTVTLAAAHGTVTPTETTLAGGLSVAPLAATFSASGTGTITARERAFPSRSGDAAVAVAAAAAERYEVTGLPSSLPAGGSVTLTLRALDLFGNLVTTYAGTAALASTDPWAALPSRASFAAGVAIAGPVSLLRSGAQAVTATELAAAGAPLTGAATTTVIAGPLATFEIAGLPASTAPGAAATITITARDAYGNVATSYSGGATLSSTDPRARITPVAPAFTAGSATASVVLETAGVQDVVAADGASSGRASATVEAPAPAAFVVTGLPASAVAGAPLSFSVRAVDALGGPVVGYAGPASLSATGGELVPASLAFVGGAGVQPATVTFTRAGLQTVTVTDAALPALRTYAYVTVAAAPASSYAFSGLSATVSAGAEVRFTLSALDAHGNVDLAYAGTATLSCSDPAATHPASVTFARGVAANVPITLRTAGAQTIVATDVANPALRAAVTVGSSAPPPPPPPPPGGSGGGGCGYGADRGLEALGLAAALLLRRRSRRDAPRPRS